MAAPNAIQQNIISNLQSIASTLLALKGKIEVTTQQYYNEIYPELVANPPTLSDADLQSIPSIAHITTGEITNAAAALQALQTWGGDLTTGNWGNLLKLLSSGI